MRRMYRLTSVKVHVLQGPSQVLWTGNYLIYLYIYKFGLSVMVGVCLFVSNKRQNGWIDWAQILCGTSHGPKEGLCMNKDTKITLQQNSIFIKIWKSTKFFFTKSANFLFVFVWQCIQRENAKLTQKVAWYAIFIQLGYLI